jgi:hypothetical protein
VFALIEHVRVNCSSVVKEINPRAIVVVVVVTSDQASRLVEMPHRGGDAGVERHDWRITEVASGGVV